MSERMKAIKRNLKEWGEARKAEGGEWVRRGECVRCGACCDSRNIDPESYRRKAAEVRERTGRTLSSICAHHGALPEQDGRLGCSIHGTRRFPPGCEAFPATVEQWRLVAGTCGYWFEWVEDGPRKVGKARRARA